MPNQNCVVGDTIRFELLRLGALILQSDDSVKHYQLMKQGRRVELLYDPTFGEPAYYLVLQTQAGTCLSGEPEIMLMLWHTWCEALPS